MKNAIIQAIEDEQTQKAIPAFRAGDTIVVSVRVKEGERERVQLFEGVVLAIRNRGLNSAFTVRKISHGVGVERTFQTHSPIVSKIEVKRHGAVRKAKLYYLRDLEGKAARIKEEIGRKKENIIDVVETKASPKAATAVETTEAQEETK